MIKVQGPGETLLELTIEADGPNKQQHVYEDEIKEAYREAGVKFRELRVKLERAFRDRCGEIGLLHSCICMYPVEHAPTESKHHILCPADHIFRWRKEHAAQLAANETINDELVGDAVDQIVKGEPCP